MSLSHTCELCLVTVRLNELLTVPTVIRDHFPLPQTDMTKKPHCPCPALQHQTHPVPGARFSKVDEREYNGHVADVRLNGTSAAVLSGTKVILHQIELGRGGGQGRNVPGGGGINDGPGPRRTFPEREDREHGEATSVGLTEAFLIYGTKAGTMEFFCLSEWAPLAGVELKHTCPVTRLWPNYLGTRVVFVDAANAGWLYSPASDKLTQVRIEGKVWFGATGETRVHAFSCMS